MYKFYKIFQTGKEKYCATFNTTLDPEYHAYIQWCRDNNVKWKLVRVSDNQIVFEG